VTVELWRQMNKGEHYLKVYCSAKIVIKTIAVVGKWVIRGRGQHEFIHEKLKFYFLFLMPNSQSLIQQKPFFHSFFN
jgi:hypothetical protein